MPQFHPDIHYLTEFAAGTLCDAHKLCVAAHLEHCHACRMDVAKLNQLGGMLFDQACGHQHAAHESTHHEDHLCHDALERVLSAIDRAEACTSSDSSLTPSSALPSAAHSNSAISDTERPSAINSNLEPANDSLYAELGSNLSHHLSSDQHFQWERITRALSIGRLKIDDKTREVALHRLEAGGRVNNHDHKGREVTVVLCGSFSDQDGLYLPGDFLVREPGDAHQPVASNDSSCVCLSVLEAPVKFTGISRLINPFLRLKPRAA